MKEFKGVLQTKFGIPDGNCFSACVATLMELPIEEVPEYQCDYSNVRWWEMWVEWFRERNIIPEVNEECPEGWAIGNLKNPCHSVIVRDGRIVWNPYYNMSIAGELEWNEFVKLRRIEVAL